ncbi:hypothetical protein [Undibacterium sp. WLHG33]|uniref:hypothetical protein n=1 Tax=Undibacterium sp. WLHG33 TaxID=3412482 RepID=UPI003C2F5061
MTDEHTKPGTNHLLNTLIKTMRLKNDAALARALIVAPPVISKLRSHKLDIGPTILIAMHEASGLAISELKQLCGIVKREDSKFSH